jgi:hypothetical protein
VPGKDEWHGPIVFFATEDRWRDLMARVLGMDISGKADDFAEPARSTQTRSPKSGPFHSGFSRNVVLTLGVGKCRETRDHLALRLEAKTAGTA